MRFIPVDLSSLSIPSYPGAAGLGLRTNGEMNSAARGGIRLLALPCVPRFQPRPTINVYSADLLFSPIPVGVS